MLILPPPTRSLPCRRRHTSSGEAPAGGDEPRSSRDNCCYLGRPGGACAAVLVAPGGAPACAGGGIAAFPRPLSCRLGRRRGICAAREVAPGSGASPGFAPMCCRLSVFQHAQPAPGGSASDLLGAPRICWGRSIHVSQLQIGSPPSFCVCSAGVVLGGGRGVPEWYRSPMYARPHTHIRLGQILSV